MSRNEKKGTLQKEKEHKLNVKERMEWIFFLGRQQHDLYCPKIVATAKDKRDKRSK